MKTQKMKAIDFLKANRFCIETTYGSYYAQQSDVELFATREEAEKVYQEATIDQSHMDDCSWSKGGDQPTFSIELMELRSIPVDMVEELQEKDAEEMEGELLDIYHTYSTRIKTKAYLFNKEAVVDQWDSEEEKAEKEKINRWQLVEYEGCTYSTLPFPEDVISLDEVI